MAEYKQINKGIFVTDLVGTKKAVEIPPNKIWQYSSEKELKSCKKKAEKRPILLIGFDTEFQSPEAITREQIAEGEGKYKVLSYQYYCKILNESDEEGLVELEWEGLCVPEINDDGTEKRLKLSEFILLALGAGFDEYQNLFIPEEVYLVGHFTKADLPAFSDFGEFTKVELDNIRRTLVDLKGSIRYQFYDEDNEDNPFCNIDINLRDTILLAPTMAKSLADLGEIVGFKKLKLADDVNEDKKLKSNMEQYRNENWDRFREYAIRDSVVCVKYFEKVLQNNFEITGKYNVPFTLSSIGTDLVIAGWISDGENYLELLGKEQIDYETYSKKIARKIKGTHTSSLSKVYFQEAFATETYHGGRNEQYWFGPGFEDDWYDYDLQSAYPTAMAMIGRPSWNKLRVLQGKKEVKNLNFDDLAMLQVIFKFPSKTRYPVLPVRALGGNIIFPIEGESYCTVAELKLAEKLGVKWDLQYGVYIPTDKSKPIFADFIKGCIKRRSEHPKGSFENYFWKEVGNSTYGKTAQGLRKKRAYDIRSDETKPIPESKLTNPFFSSFITGFVRASLGEMMNALPDDKMVFSVTTDGFLTNATPDQLMQASKGELAKRYLDSRTKLIDEHDDITEIKHRIRQPLGWRTRGQATLKRGPDGKKGDPKPIVCAKAGIKVEHYFDEEQQNIEIVEKFLNRSPSDKVVFRPFISVKDQLRFDNDNVPYLLERKLSMEFDLKRMPFGACETTFRFNDQEYAHVSYHTKPWNDLSEFKSVRDLWEDYIGSTEYRNVNIKTLDDLKAFVQFANERSNIAPENKSHMSRTYGALRRIRRSMVTAFFKSHAGFSPTDVMNFGTNQNVKFAEILTSCGVPATNQDVANDKNKPFEFGIVPNTAEARIILKKLKSKHFPQLKIEDLIWKGKGLTIKLHGNDPFIAKLSP